MERNNDDNKPLISVLMTSYNYAGYIREAVDSVIAQAYKNWELIIVDDGSEDNSVEIIKEYEKNYPGQIRLYTHPGNENRNIAESMSLGLQQVKGEYIAFLESDDMMGPGCLSEKIEIFTKDPELSLVYSDIDLFGDEKEIHPKYSDYIEYIRYAAKFTDKQYDFLKILLMRNPVATFSNMMVKMQDIKEFNFNKGHQNWLDWWVLIHLAMKGKFHYINKKLCRWRIHKSSSHYKYMENDSGKGMYEKFVSDALELVRLEMQPAGHWEEFKKEISGMNAKLFNLKHNLGFALDSPMAVIRKIIGRK